MRKMKLIYCPIVGNTPQIITLINEMKLGKYILAVEYRTQMKGFVIMKVPEDECQDVAEKLRVGLGPEMLLAAVGLPDRKRMRA